MILCVTLNPCLDKTLTVPAWRPGDSVRGTAVREVVGGKGNNVARALKRLGRASARPVTVLGGPTGRALEALPRRAPAAPVPRRPDRRPRRGPPPPRRPLRPAGHAHRGVDPRHPDRPDRG